MEIDASNFALEVVFSHMGKDEKLHSVTFYSRKFSTTKNNYEIHDKELVGIVDSFEE